MDLAPELRSAGACGFCSFFPAPRESEGRRLGRRPALQLGPDLGVRAFCVAFATGARREAVDLEEGSEVTATGPGRRRHCTIRVATPGAPQDTFPAADG